MVGRSRKKLGGLKSRETRLRNEAMRAAAVQGSQAPPIMPKIRVGKRGSGGGLRLGGSAAVGIAGNRAAGADAWAEVSSEEFKVGGNPWPAAAAAPVAAAAPAAAPAPRALTYAELQELEEAEEPEEEAPAAPVAVPRPQQLFSAAPRALPPSAPSESCKRAVRREKERAEKLRGAAVGSPTLKHYLASKGNADTAGKGHTLRDFFEKQASPFAGRPRASPPPPLTGEHHLRPREAGSQAGALSAAGEERAAKRAKAGDRESASDSEADLSTVAAAVEAEEAKAAAQDPVSASEAGQDVSPAPAQTGKLLGKKRTAEEAGIAAVPAASPPDRAALAAPRPSLMGDDIVRAAPDPEHEKFNKARECIISALEEMRRDFPAKVIELVGLRCYFTYRLAGMNATVASSMTASAVYPDAAATKPRRIHEAAMHFAEHLKLRERKKPKQGPNSQARE